MVNPLRGLRATNTMVTGLAMALMAHCVTASAFEWQTASPESQRLDGPALDGMSQALEQHGTKALLTIRHDRIVYEWYAEGMSRTTRHYAASLPKAIVGAHH